MNSFDKNGAHKHEYCGEIRQSQMITTWGPGSILSSRDSKGNPICVLVPSLEHWYPNSPQVPQENIIHELRLEKSLRKLFFVKPPVTLNNHSQPDKRPYECVLPTPIFPKYFQCRHCSRLKHLDQWPIDLDHRGVQTSSRYCSSCRKNNKGDAIVNPVSYIVACPQGHLADFPWKQWSGCTCRAQQEDLYLEQRFAGLKGQFVKCKQCQQEKSLGTVFQKDSLQNINYTCLGRHDWLPSSTVCSEAKHVRTIYRGASNVYFAHAISRLSLPPRPYQNIQFSSLFKTSDLSLNNRINSYIEIIQDQNTSEEERRIIVKSLTKTIQTHFKPDTQRYLDYLNIIRQQKVPLDVLEPFFEEYTLFEEVLSQEHGVQDNTASFKAKKEPISKVDCSYFDKHLSNLVLASKLREVIALKGFTRLYPKKGAKVNPLSKQVKAWLPAVEIKGEGIFIQFNLEYLQKWEAQKNVQDRMDLYLNQLSSADQTVEHFEVSARGLLLHSFSHALMRTLSLECGYSTSALKERIYVDSSLIHPMAGILIYTGSPDAEGTLGGLVERGRKKLISNTIAQALQNAEWCSSDPFCISSDLRSIATNQSACHNCLLIAETSCQIDLFNGYLDRALLVGTPNDPSLGYFNF